MVWKKSARHQNYWNQGKPHGPVLRRLRLVVWQRLDLALVYDLNMILVFADIGGGPLRDQPPRGIVSILDGTLPVKATDRCSRCL